MVPPEDNHLDENTKQPSKGELGPVRETVEGEQRADTALLPVESTGGPLAAVSTRPRILTASPEPIKLLLALRRRWLLAVILAFCFSIPAALIAWFFVPVTYTAQSWLLTRDSSMIFNIKNAEASDWESHEQLIRGYRVCNAALSQPGISELPWIKKVNATGIDPADWLSTQLTIDIPSSKREKLGYGNQLLLISMTGDDPQQLKKLVQAITDAYLDRVVDEERDGFLKQRENLERSYDEKAEEVRRKREDLQVIARDLGTADAQTANTAQQLLLDQVLYLRRQIGVLRTEYTRKERELITYEKQVGWLAHTGNILPEDIENEMAENPDLQRYDERLAEIQKELDAYRQIYRDKTAAPIRQREEEITRLLAEQEDLKQGLRARFLAAIRSGERKSEVQLTHERLETEFKEARQYYENVRSEYAQLADQVKDLGEYSADLVRRQEELEQLTRVTNEVSYELEKLDLELSAGIARVRLAEESVRVPKTGDERQRNRITVMAALGGLALGLVGPMLLEFYRRRITSGSDMSDGLGIRVLGNLPMLSKPKRRFGFRAPTAEAIEDLQVAMDESTDGLRAMLLHHPAAKDVRTLMVTSAVANEGKTTVATSLAASMGRSGRRTLLLDGDLRRPSAHRLLEMPLEDGLAEILRGELSVENAIRPSRMAGLRFLSAGHCDQVSLQTLTKENLGEIFEKLRSEFDYIIVDSAPVLSIVDSLLIGHYCDAALISVVREVSCAMPIYETTERLRSTQISIVGCVVNGVQSSSFAPGYYTYGYGYGNVQPLADDTAGESPS
jgi:capsular exopolysaccharide synthesis family protein